MVRLGFSREIVDAWFASMHCLSRQTLIAGAVYGDSSSTTGIPEGDPMSILGMFALCCLFREVVADYNVRALIFSYADNWEIVVDHPESLQDLIVALDRMTQVCLLPVAPAKCWTWALKASDRSKLKNCELSGQRVPVKTTGCCLGADMSYSFRVAAATRNQRVAAGHQRLLRLRGIPTSRFRKRRLVLGGVFPQALHACEASWVPVSVFGRLRSKVVQALKVDGSGVNPYLAANICAPANVDPQFAALLSRLRLFRQLWKDFPVYRPILLARLASAGSKFKTPTTWSGLCRTLVGNFLMGSVFRMRRGGLFPSSPLPSVTFALCWLISGAGISLGKCLIGKGLPLSTMLILSSVVLLSPCSPARGVFWGNLCAVGTLPVILGLSLLALPATVRAHFAVRLRIAELTESMTARPLRK